VLLLVEHGQAAPALGVARLVFERALEGLAEPGMFVRPEAFGVDVKSHDQLGDAQLLDRLPGFKRRLEWFIAHRPDLTQNVASMQTRPQRADREPVDLRRLVAGFLRMAPDVAIVGEVRDKEALPLLLTLSSGVKGFTTIHAGSARQALSRLRFICQLSETSSEIPLSALNALVTSGCAW